MRHQLISARRGSYCTARDLQRARQRGFTMLEVLFAGFVFTVASLGLSANLAASSQRSEIIRQELVARQAMRATMAQMRTMPFDEMLATYAGTTFEVEGLRAPETGQAGMVMIEPGPSGAADLYRITLRVRWRHGSETRMVESAHLVTRIHG